MYFLCTIHPELEETQEEGYVGAWMTLKEKWEAIDKFYERKRHVPIGFLHTASKQAFALMPEDKRAGHIIDLFCDAEGDMVAKCVIPRDNPAFAELNRSVHVEKRTWGVSPRIDFALPEGYGGPMVKTLTHVALTETPLMADKGTYIHHWATNEQAINHAINREYFAEGQGHCYAAPQLKRVLSELKGMRKFVSSSHKLPVTPPHAASFIITTSSSSLFADYRSVKQPSSESNATTKNNMQDQQQQQQQQQDATVPSQPATAAAAAQNVQEIDESLQQQRKQQQQQQQTSGGAPSTMDFDGLMQLQKAVAEMESLLTDGVKLSDMPPDFKKKYLEAMTRAENRAEEMEKHVDYFVGKGLLQADVADGYKQLIRNSRHEEDAHKNTLKRSIMGFVEASEQDNRRMKEENAKIFEQQRKRTQLMMEEKEVLSRELEEVRKKVKANEFLADNSNVQSLQDRFGSDPYYGSSSSSIMNNRRPQPTGSTKTIDMLDSALLLAINRGQDTKTVTAESYTRREPVDMHLRSQYDHTNRKGLTTDDQGAASMARLMQAATSLL
jgi:hypothetical protein